MGEFSNLKKESGYISQEYRLDVKMARLIKEILWTEHPVGTSPDDYSFNENSNGVETTITFNSTQIEADFKAIAQRANILL